MVIDASRQMRNGLPPDEVQRRDDMVTILENIATVTGGDLMRLSGTADAAYGTRAARDRRLLRVDVRATRVGPQREVRTRSA